ncbi:hypothetical protein [Polaribacter sp. Asnod6-C07]|uniref:hypothetical protein n=1 Tax=Polaribacter sp. Asnod6-C07 TaxID=3160582 RepID=UPI00386ADF7E
MRLKVYPIIILNIFILFACQKNKTDNHKVIQKNDSEKIIEFQPEKSWKITSKGIGFIELGNSISKTVSLLSKNYVLKKTFMNTYNVYKNGEKILYLEPIENTDIINSIRILSNNWESESGLKLGISIKEINTFYENFYLEYDVSKINEYFPEYGSFEKNNKNYKSIVKYYFTGGGFDYIGEYDFDDTKKTIYKSIKNSEKANIFMIDINIIQ